MNQDDDLSMDWQLLGIFALSAVIAILGVAACSYLLYLAWKALS